VDDAAPLDAEDLPGHGNASGNAKRCEAGMTPDPMLVESIKRAAQDLLGRILENGIDMEPEFMDVLELLATNPVREDLR
jgi:hypothetical protein